MYFMKNSISESEESYRDLFNDVPFAIYIQESNGCFLDVNEMAVKTYGYPREFFIGKTPEFLSAPGKNDLEAVSKAIQKAFDGIPQHFEFWGLKSNGEVFPKEVHLKKGKFFGKDVIIATAYDISERKASEVRERWLSSVLERSLNEVYSFDAETLNFTYANRGALLNLGYTMEELRTMTPLDIEPQHSRESFEALLKPLRSGEREATTFESVHRRKDGSTYDVYHTLQFTNSELGPRFTEIALDITDRKRVEESLRKSEESARKNGALLRSIMESPQSIVIFALDADYRYTWFTTAHKETMKTIWGVEIEVGMNMLDAIGDPVDREKAKHNFDRVLQGEHFILLEEYGDTAHYRTFYEDRYSSIVDENGAVSGLTVFVTDITERNRAEKRLAKINECFFSFVPNPRENINRLVALCGELMEATCALYNRLEGEMLCSWGQWHTPPGYNPVDKPTGHICYDVIKHGGDQVLVLRNLSETLYAQTDPNVGLYKLQTYIGRAVKFGDTHVGSLCVVYQDDFVPSEDDMRLMEIIASAVGVEERRRQSEDELRESEEKYRSIFENFVVGIYRTTIGGQYLIANPAIARMHGYTSPEELMENIADLNTRFYVIPDRRAEFIRQVEEHGYVENFESEVYRKDGSITWISENARALRNAGGELIGFEGTVIDITERKTAEENLREMTTQLSAIAEEQQMLLNNTLDFLYRHDTHGVFTYVSPVVEHVLGYSVEEYKKPYAAYMTDNPINKKAIEYTEETLRTGKKSPPYLVEVVHKSGGHVVLEVNERAYFEGGKIAGIIGVARDVTERKQVEAALRTSEARFRALAEHSPSGIWIQQGFHFLYVNPAAERFTGYTAVELYQMNVMDLVHPDFRDFVKQRAIARLKGLKFTDHYEFAIVTKNGEKRYIDFGGTLIEFDDKPAIIASAYDITDRKRMEEALKKSEEQYRSFFEEDATADVLFQPDGRVEDCNPAYVKMFRLNSREEALATKIFEFCLDKESREKTLGLIREQRKLFDHELVLRRRDDSPLYAKANFIGVFDEHGELIQIKAYLIDETERKSLEKRLIQSQKLEGIGRLAGGVAHDYNNILGVILGYGELIQNKLKKEDPLHRQIQSIVAAANRGKDLTRQLLAFARKEIVSPKVLNVNTSIDSIQKMLQRLIGENIKLIFMPGKSLWSIKIDPTQLDQILVNLATNARDAISDIGTITIETANVAIDEAYLNGHAEFFPGEYVMLGFTDTGKGMDRATQEKIFEPFFTTKPKGQGTGLGLATVYGIVKQNGGNINVYSELGKGTTVKIYLPRFYGEAEEAEEIEEDKSTVGTETVLVVEDQADLLELAKNSLEEYGYKVLTAWTPGEAILLCGEYTEEIDLLLTDVIMPVMNGKELKKRIDKLKPGIKTIFMSGYTANVIAHRGILEEGIEFIQKPFTPRALAKKVHDVLQK